MGGRLHWTPSALSTKHNFCLNIMPRRKIRWIVQRKNTREPLMALHKCINKSGFRPTLISLFFSASTERMYMIDQIAGQIFRIRLRIRSVSIEGKDDTPIKSRSNISNSFRMNSFPKILTDHHFFLYQFVPISETNSLMQLAAQHVGFH